MKMIDHIVDEPAVISICDEADRKLEFKLVK